MRLVQLSALFVLLTSGLVGCGEVRGIEQKNRCVTSADCNAPHVCVNGVCALGTYSGNDASQPDVTISTDGNDANDASDGNGASDANEATMSKPPDPCDAVVPGAQPPLMTLAQELVGTWSLCPSTPPGDLAFLTGPSGHIQLTSTRWVPLADSTPDGGASPPGSALTGGAYYFLLEAQTNVAHFAGVDHGADLGIAISDSSGLLMLTVCDGVVTCAGTTIRLVRLGAPLGSGADTGGPDAMAP